MKKITFNSSNVPIPTKPYSHAVIAGDLLFVSGQVPTMLDGSGIFHGEFNDEARLALVNLKTILEDAGSSLDQVVKTTVFLDDINKFEQFNQVYREFFTTDFPARTCIQAGKLPMGVQVEVEAIALRGE